jgi:hypothetical protein
MYDTEVYDLFVRVKDEKIWFVDYIIESIDSIANVRRKMFGEYVKLIVPKGFLKEVLLLIDDMSDFVSLDIVDYRFGDGNV